MKEFRIISRYFINSLQTNLASPWIFLIYFFSKLTRYGTFLGFLFLMTSQLKFIGGYSPVQVLIFYLCFNVIDTSAQLLFREVYRFRPLVNSGGFDMVLVKPLNPLIRVLVGGPDFIDAGILLVLLGILIFTIVKISPDASSLLGFGLLLVNSLLIATAFHIFVLGIGILTLSVDHIIMIYRDLTSLVRIPVDFYTQPLRSIITFVIPLGIMFTFPAKALFGLLGWQSVVGSFVMGLSSLFLSIKFWNYSLKHYQSASS